MTSMSKVYNENGLPKHHTVTWRMKAGIVEPEQTSIAEQRLGNNFHATTNSNERIVAK
jgi:hypothetical protein